MANIKDDILKKTLDGKVATDPSIKAEEEPFKSNTLPRKTVAAPIRTLGWTPGDVRFVGNVSDPTLYAQSAPDTHPRRTRRLVQEQLFYGMDVYAEGTAGELVVSNQLDTHGVNVDFVLGAPYNLTLSDLLLVVSNRDRSSTSPTPRPEEGAPRTYTINSLSGDVITISGDFESIFDGSGLPDNEGFYWQLVKPNPVELLPFSATKNLGEETSYFTVQPKRWPVRRTLGSGYDANDSKEMSITSVEYTAEGRLQVAVEHDGASQILEVGDFVANTAASAKQPLELQDRIFVVESTISFTAGAPSTEEFVLTPFYDTDVSTLPEQGWPYSLRKIHTVKDLFPAGHPTVGHPLKDFRSGQPHIQDLGVRVKPLIGPKDVDNPQSIAAGSILAGDRAGHALTLFPAKDDGFGNAIPDLDSPISNFDGIQINSSTEDQWVNVDYDNGVVTLSHPIEAGYALNPNSYTDGDGRARLFAMFVAYNEKSVSQAARELVHRAEVDVTAKGGNAGRIRLGGQNYSERGAPIERSKGWLMEFPMVEANDLYHYDPVANEGGNEEVIGFTRSAAGDDEVGPQQQYQHKSLSSGMYHLGSMRFGHTDSTRRHNQFIFVPDAATEQGTHNGSEDTQQFGEANKPSYRITYSAVEFLTTKESTWSNVTLSNSDLHFVINDVEVVVTLGTGSYTASSLASTLDSVISSAATTAGVDPGDYTVQSYDPTSSGDPQVQIKAGTNLFFYTGDGHSNFGFPENEGVDPEGIRLQYGHNGTIESTLEWVRDTNDLVFDGNDIQLGTGESIKDHETRITTNEGDILSNSNAVTSVTNRYENSADYLSINQGKDSFSIEGSVFVPDGATFIQATVDNRLGDVYATSSLTDFSPYDMTVDGEGCLYVFYLDINTTDRTIKKYELNGVSNTETVVPANATFQSATGGVLDCNGKQIVVGTNNGRLHFYDPFFVSLGEISTAGTIIDVVTRHEDYALTLERDPDGSGGYNFVLRLYNKDTGLVDDFTMTYSSAVVDEYQYLAAEGGRVYTASDDGTGVNLRAFNYSSTSAPSSQLWSVSVGSGTEDINDMCCDGEWVYLFGVFDTDVVVRKVDRNGYTTKDLTDATLGDTGVGAVDQNYVYFEYNTSVYAARKDLSEVVTSFDTVNAFLPVGLETEGTFLVYASGETGGSTTTAIDIWETGDRGGVWKRTVAGPPMWKGRSPLFGD